MRLLLWADAIGLAVFSTAGAERITGRVPGRMNEPWKASRRLQVDVQ